GADLLMSGFLFASRQRLASQMGDKWERRESGGFFFHLRLVGQLLLAIMGKIGLDSPKKLCKRLLLLLIEPSQRLLFGPPHRFLDGADRFLAAFGQKDMRLAGVQF